jgi:nitrate reductase NapE component
MGDKMSEMERYESEELNDRIERFLIFSIVVALAGLGFLVWMSIV